MLENKNNSSHYNKMLRSAERRKKKVPIKKKDFSSQEVDFSKYLIVPSGYEGIGYTLYILIVPYVVGIVFLFFYVARAAYTSFSLLDLGSFLIIWLIGYEITSAIILVLIFFAYIKYLKNS